jgi:uroporphyrinogen decarboxylase
MWLMRQAGRYLPEYRELKAKSSFLEMVRTPSIAAEVTLQPLKRFSLDAAILFSDILVIPEALGQGYHFRDQGGIGMDFRLDSRVQIDALASADVVPERLQYVAETLRLLKRELGRQKERIKLLFYTERSMFDALLEKLSAALVTYFRMQIEAGADCIQIFDSWGGIIAGHDYEAASLQWIRKIVSALPPNVPVILYAKGTAPHHAAQAASGVSALSVDWTSHLPSLARQLSAAGTPLAVQGNLDPVLLNTTPAIVQRETNRLLTSMRGINGHIFNLGHGILPQAKIECVQALVDSVVEFR